MLLSVCMVIRDKARTISKTINSIKEIADEIILIDIDSFDNTRLIAEGMGAKVFQFKNNPGFNESRNFARKKAEGKWVLFLEGDEELLDDYRQLRTFLKNTDNDGFYLPVIGHNLRKKSGYFGKGPDNGFPVPRLSLRLYQNKKNYYYNNDNYESITNSILKTDGEASLKVLHLPIMRRYFQRIIPVEIQPAAFFYFQLEQDNIIVEEIVSRYIKEGIRRYWQGENSLAISKFEEAYLLANEKNKGIILENIIFLLLEDKQYKRAEGKIDFAVKNYSTVFLNFWQGYINYIKGNFQEAVLNFKKILNTYFPLIEERIKYNVYFLLGMSLLANNNLEEAELYLEKSFYYDRNNKLIINTLLEIKGMEIDRLFKFFNLDDPANKKVFFILLECLFARREYLLLENIINKQMIIREDNKELLYWKGLIYLKQEKYKLALEEFRKIGPDFIYYQDVLHLQWVLNLIMPGRHESKSIVNQIKLLGNKINWSIIKYFNEIYFYGREFSFRFDHLLAKLKFYERALYFLDLLINYGCSKAIIIMLEIIDTLKISRANRDIGFLFYIHGYWEQAYHYLKMSLEKGVSLPETGIMAEVCRKMSYFSEEKEWIEESEYLDSYKETNIHCRKYALFVE